MSSFVDENVSESKQQQQQQLQQGQKLSESKNYTPQIAKIGGTTVTTTTSGAIKNETTIDDDNSVGKTNDKLKTKLANESENKCETTFKRATTTTASYGNNFRSRTADAGNNSTPNEPSSLREPLLLAESMSPGDLEQEHKQQQQQQKVDICHVTKDNIGPAASAVGQQQELKLKIHPGFTSSQPNAECAANVSIGSSESSTPTTVASPLPPLPLGLSSSFGTHLPHISSEPTFGVQLRKKQQENSTKETPDNYSSVIKSGTMSATASPNMVRKSSDGAVSLPRRVSFPKSDNELVTGYLEPANPWVHVCLVKSISEIAELYMTSCQKHNTKPLQCVLDHLKAVDLTKQLRQPLLSLKSIQLAPSDCEALEEVLKRVQYKSIDLSDCKLNETAASALFEMIEYYEATNELDISSNSIGMTHRGWISCTYMISHSQELQVLNAEGNPISKLSADHLGNALNTSNLHTLKLEHCSLKGAPLSGLCFKLWHNRALKELWVAYNELDCNDADTIAEMLKVNHYLELIDISNNNIGDGGLRHIVMSLIMQSKELERRTTFQRAAAIDDDESMSPFETSAPVDLCDSKESEDWGLQDDSQSLSKSSENDVDNETKCKPSLATIEEKMKIIGSGDATSDIVARVENEPKPVVSSFKPPLISTVGTTIEEIDPDEDTDETVRSSTLKSTLQTSVGGQSMLDKLLSMNSESSSEDGVSNLSTDTLAACCSEDASLISDDIYDVAATPTSTATTTIANTNIKYPTDEDTSMNEGTKNAISNPSVISTCVTRTSLQSSPRETELDIDMKIVTPTEGTSSVLIQHPAVTSVVSSIQSPRVNNITNNNNNNDNNNVNVTLLPAHTSLSVFSNNAGEQTVDTAGIFEVKAEERNCQQSGAGVAGIGSGELRENVDHTNVMQHHAASKALDVNKNTKLGEDFDDTHSTDSAFESASEGDISRHLPEEFTRLSASLESTRLDDLAKEFSIETATIASESNECLIAAAVHATPSSTPTPQKFPFTQISTPLSEKERLAADTTPTPCISSSLPSAETATPPTIQVGFGVLQEPTESPIDPVKNEFRDKMPKVTIAQDSLAQKCKTNSVISTSPTQTPPPPSTSPGGVSCGLRRTESTCAFLTQSTRNRSQSTDSLCSDNSLDGSIGSGDLNFSTHAQLNEKLTKNDTLTRQQRQLESSVEASTRTPGGLKALALWNNNLSKEAGLYISNLLAETVSLELLNIGKNCLSNDFVTSIKDSLTKNTTVTTLGLQSAHLSAKGIETLTSIMTFGGNSTLQRIDIRGNKVEVESLTKIAEVLKSNTTVTQIDIDDEPKRLSGGSEAHLDYARVLENVRSMCARNEKTQAQMQHEKASMNPMIKKRGGYYLGSRKISLTCHSRPIVDTSNPVVVTCSAPSNSKLEVKRKPGARLRSPVPSPTTISPSSSPNRGSRFQVFRVAEVSPLSSPSIQKHMGSLGATKAMSSSSVFIQSESSDGGNDPVYPNLTSTSLPTSCSLPSMATISSSTQSIKRLSVSPRSRFLVRKIYEDPTVPLSSRTVPPITPPIYPPPTPMSRNSKEASEQTEEATSTPTTQEREDSKHTRTLVHPTIVTPPTITSSLSLKQQQQQQNNTTTDTCATPILKVRELPRGTQSEQSTNTTTINDITNPNAITTKTCSSTIQPSPSILSTLSTFSSSSSSSTSDASSSSSSSSSTSPASNVDSTDSSSSASSSVHPNIPLCPHIDTQDLTVSGQCPIAVFGDNDITLTKNTVNEALVSAAVAVARDNINNVPSDDNVAPPATQHQRARKVSWIANPTAVDKLLTLFHNPFQRSSSPESKGVTGGSVPTSSPGSQLSQSPLEQSTLEQNQQSASQKSLIPLRKQSPPSWSRLGTDILTAAGSNNVDLANTVATTAAAVVTEQSRSFLDAASKQFRDFSKQVFRQNISFGNESVTTASTTTITSSTVNNPNSGEGLGELAGFVCSGAAGAGGITGGNVTGVTSSCAMPSSSAIEYNVDSLPTDVKQEIKENISPEHTINEETLQKLQKLHGNTTTTATGISSADCKYDSEDISAKDAQAGVERND